MGLVAKLDCGWSCCIGTPTCVIGVLGITGYKKVMNYSLINHFNLSSTKGQSLNSCPTCWQYVCSCSFNNGFNVYIQYTSLNRWLCNDSHNKYTRPNNLVKRLCLLDNNKYYNYFHRFYMRLKTKSMWRFLFQVA